MAKASKTDRDLKKLNRDLGKMFKDIKNKKEMTIIGNDAIDIIRDRTQNNMQGVSKPQGRRRKLRKVTPEYAEYRKKIKNKSRMAASGRDCNLTLRGSMLKNLSVVYATASKLRIGHTGKKNQLKTEYHHDNGRAFLFLSLDEIRKVLDLYDKRVGRKSIKV